jgi:hypothetical protein
MEEKGNPIPEAEKTPTGESKIEPEKKEETYTKDTVSKLIEREVGKVLKKKDAEILQLNSQIEEFKGKDLGELEKLQKKYDKLVEDHKTTAGELTGVNLKLAKLTTLLKAGAQPDKLEGLIKRVAGTTPEEIEADVQELVSLGWIGPAKEPEPETPGANGSGKPPVKGAPKTFTKAQMKAMTPEEYEANRPDILKAMEANQIT